MHWEDEYSTNERVWGDEPSELARAAVDHLKKTTLYKRKKSILDIGCGYGRDAYYYVDNLHCTVMGIDVAAKGIEIAQSAALERGTEGVNFECRDFRELGGRSYDVVCASNLYQLLRPYERRAFREAVKKFLKPGGLLFLSTLSIGDPEHFGDGDPIPGEVNSYSFTHRVYLHFCTRKELSNDFAFLHIVRLHEHEYDEPRAEGKPHHHISWILIAEYADDWS